MRLLGDGDRMIHVPHGRGRVTALHRLRRQPLDLAQGPSTGVAAHAAGQQGGTCILTTTWEETVAHARSCRRTAIPSTSSLYTADLDSSESIRRIAFGLKLAGHGRPHSTSFSRHPRPIQARPKSVRCLIGARHCHRGDTKPSPPQLAVSSRRPPRRVRDLLVQFGAHI